MASPWIVPTPQRRAPERPWMGLVLLLSIPFFSLILIRMVWSASTLWFLMVGLALLGAGAVTFLARRPNDPYLQPNAAQQSNRPSLVLGGLGALLLALLIVPNFSSASSTPGGESARQQNNIPGGLTTQVSGVSQAPARRTPTQQAQHTATAQQQSPAPTVQPTPQTQPTAQSTRSTPPAGSQVYTVKDGDTLWDIAAQFSTTVDAIVAANNLTSADNLKLGQTLIIPASQ